jgi:hypothetical protein
MTSIAVRSLRSTATGRRHGAADDYALLSRAVARDVVLIRGGEPPVFRLFPNQVPGERARSRLLGPGADRPDPDLRAERHRSAKICFTTCSAGIALTPPPPWVAEEAW